MINGYVGFAIMLLLALYLFFKKKTSKQMAWQLLVLALPMSFIGILGIDSNQHISWYNVVLPLLLIAEIKENRYISKGATFFLMFSVLFLFLGAIASNDLTDSFKEMIQFLMMLVPLSLFIAHKESAVMLYDDLEDLINLYIISSFATAIAMILQFITHTFLNLDIGIIGYSGITKGRVSFFCLFRGASVLPIYMGSGLLFLIIKIMNGKKIKFSLLISVTIFIAMVLNSSRSGMVALVIISLLYMLKNMIVNIINHRISIIPVFFILAILVGAYSGSVYLSNLRSIKILDNNGRIDVLEYGLHVWTYSQKNILLGEGYSGGLWVGQTSPHNMLVQTLAENGVLLFTVLLIGLIWYIKKNWKNDYVYVVFYLLLCGMLITEFYANAFFTVCFILVDYYAQSRLKKERVFFGND